MRKLKAAAEKTNKQASGSWDKLEQVFEDRVSRSLASLGIPSRQEFDALMQRVEVLSAAVAALAGKEYDAGTNTIKPAGKPTSKPVFRKAPTINGRTKKTTPQTLNATKVKAKKSSARTTAK